MSRQTAVRPAARAVGGTQTQTYDSASEQSDSRHIGTLRLRGEPRQQRGVRWAADVVDNSNMGKKKSKVCCIYHKPRAVGESSSESDSSSSDSASDSEPDNSMAKMGGRGAARRKPSRKQKHDCDHDHNHNDSTPDSSASDNEDDGDTGDSTVRQDGPSSRRGRVRRASPNAYEKMKTYKTKKGGSSTMTVTETVRS